MYLKEQIYVLEIYRQQSLSKAAKNLHISQPALSNYLNHLEQVKLQLSREPRALPQMKINPDVKDIFDFKYEDFELINYNPHPHIAGKVAV